MATHDYVIDNSTGANVRADINSVLQAILTNNSSSSAPSTTAAYMFWADTTSGILKIRNSSDNAWVELLQLDGTLTLEDGSASTPGLAFRDDLNTGIFSSAADTFNVATAGVERMELGATTIFNEDGADVDFRIEGDTEANLFYVDAGNDRIGIGTPTPNTSLEISTATADLNLQRTGTHSTSDGPLLQFKGRGPNAVMYNFAKIDGVSTGSNNQGHLRFFTNLGGSQTEKMRLDKDGKLGIGTSSPSSLLNLDGGSSNAFVEVDGTGRYRGFEIHEGGSRKAYFHHDLTGNLAIINTVEAALAFHTGDTENMRLSGANLGIGTTSPSTLLHTSLAAENGSIATFGLSGQTNNQSFIIKADDSDSLFTFRFGSSNSTYPAVRFNMGADQEAMRIDSSGNVGIGTTSPTSKLNVAGRLDVDGLQNQNTAEIVANSTSGQSFGLLVNAGSTSADYCANFRDKDAGSIMLLRGDGQIGIGTSTPNRTIEIKKSSPGIRLEELTSGGNKRLEFFVDGSEANIAAPQSSQTIMFSVSGADTMRLARSGSHAEVFINTDSILNNGVLCLKTNGSNGIAIRAGATNSQTHQSFQSPNGIHGTITTDGSNTQYNTSSDYRLKENVTAISDGITRIKNLLPKRFNFKLKPEVTQDGFLAHEVSSVVPEAVSGDKDAVDSNGDVVSQQLDTSKLIPLLVASVQELITKVEALEAA